MLKLFILEGPDKGESFELKKDTQYLGRSEQNDIRLKDPSISARHMRIVRREERFFIQDLKSTNGTYLDGRLLSPGEEVEVREGHPIAVGGTLMCLDREFSVGGTLVQHAVKFPKGFRDYLGSGPYRDRPLTNLKNLQLMYKVSNALTQSLDINDILEKVMEYLFDCLKRIDRGAVLLLDGDTGRLSETIARSRQDGKHTSIDYSRTIVNRVIKEGKPVTMADTSSELEADLSDSIKALKIRSVMCVPLVSRSRIRGAIYVDSLHAPHGFRKEDLQLLMGLASPAAIAIENALLYARQERRVESRTRTLHRTEQRLRKSEARFRAIFDNMKSGVVVYEVGGDAEEFLIADVNYAAEEMEGIDRGQVRGKRLEEVFPGYGRVGLPEVFRRVWRTGESEHVPAFLYEDERTSGWREYDVYRLPSGEIVTLFNDLTGVKKSEEEQRALQNRLLGSQKLESLGRLAGGVAHNFRNILQAVLGNVEYLDMIHGDDPEVKETVRNINNSVDKGVGLVNSLLHFSKVGVEFNPVVLDLKDVILETYTIIERVFDKRIQVELKLADGLFVNGNRSLLGQVFMNLFTNARDAMPEGGRLAVQADRTGNQVWAVVSDTGHGMDQETLERIFEPFFSAKDVGKGTGLGLSTVHGIVAEHGGRIAVSSTPGKGTVFKIYFPLAEKRKDEREKSEKQVVQGKGQKILIVDDEPSSLEALVGLAKGLNYDVQAAARPTEALKKYAEWRPDLVLMDRNMPEMDGVACIKELLKEDRDARIIIVSGYEESGPNGIDETVSNMIKGYLTKPCGLEELSRTLSRVLAA